MDTSTRTRCGGGPGGRWPEEAQEGRFLHNALFVSPDPGFWGGPWQLPNSEKPETTKALAQKESEDHRLYGHQPLTPWIPDCVWSLTGYRVHLGFHYGSHAVWKSHQIETQRGTNSLLLHF